MHQNRGGLYNKDDALWLLYKRLTLHETSVVCFFVLYCTLLFCTMYYTAGKALFWITLYGTVIPWLCTEQHCTVLYYTE